MVKRIPLRQEVLEELAHDGAVLVWRLIVRCLQWQLRTQAECIASFAPGFCIGKSVGVGVVVKVTCHLIPYPNREREAGFVHAASSSDGAWDRKASRAASRWVGCTAKTPTPNSRATRRAMAKPTEPVAFSRSLSVCLDTPIIAAASTMVMPAAVRAARIA